jgi:hypothetical protein
MNKINKSINNRRIAMANITINSNYGSPLVLTHIDSRLNKRRDNGAGHWGIIHYLQAVLGDRFTTENLTLFYPHLTTDEIAALDKYMEEEPARLEKQRKLRAETEAREKALAEAREKAHAEAQAIAKRKITLVKLVDDDSLLARVSKDAKKNGWSVEHQVMIENLTVDQETRGNYIFGLDWRMVCRALGITHQELNWWREERVFPSPDGLVDSYEFTSMSWSRSCVVDAWLPETVTTAKPMIEQWRADHKAKMKEHQKEQARIRRQAKKTAEAIEKQEAYQ